MNDGSFLGQRRDPGLVDGGDGRPAVAGFDRALVSPSRRARETAALLAPGVPCVEDDRILEIDYGEAEGMSCEELASAFPRGR